MSSRLNQLAVLKYWIPKAAQEPTECKLSQLALADEGWAGAEEEHNTLRLFEVNSLASFYFCSGRAVSAGLICIIHAMSTKKLAEP